MTTMVPGPFSSRPYWRVPLSGSTSAIWAGVSHRQDAAGKDVPGAGGSRRPWSINSLLALFGVSQLTCSALARREGPCRRLASLMRPQGPAPSGQFVAVASEARDLAGRHGTNLAEASLPARRSTFIVAAVFRRQFLPRAQGVQTFELFQDGGVVRAPPRCSRHLCPSPADQDHSRGTRAKPAERCRAPGCKQFKTRISAGRTLLAPIMRLRRCADVSIRTPCSGASELSRRHRGRLLTILNGRAILW